VPSSLGQATTLALNAADDPTRIFVARQTKLLEKSSLCYSGVNTIAMALRGAMVSDCLQLDIVANAKGELSLRVPNPTVPGMAIEAAVDISDRNKLALWLQVGALHQPRVCQQVLAVVEPRLASGLAVLVSVNAETRLNDLNVMNCLRTLKQKGVSTAYSLPRTLLLSCVTAIPAATATVHVSATATAMEILKETSTESTTASSPIGSFTPVGCQPLSEKIDRLAQADLFTDLSFDEDGLRAVKQLVNAQTFRWNMTNVEPRKLLDIDTNWFRLVGLNSRDLNARQ
jgi:hypothetical protein